ADFRKVQNLMLGVFESQGIRFEDVLICPHFKKDQCMCRKPNLGLVRPFLTSGNLDMARSAVIGDRETDLELATNMGISGIRIGIAPNENWQEIARMLTTTPRRGRATRKTRETTISVEVDLDSQSPSEVSTGIGFYDHMLEQIAKHGGFNMRLKTTGDLHVDEHHTVEDTALALGEALRAALGDKLGIGRYGFVLPMDEAEARVSIDLSARPFLLFKGTFPRENVGGLPTELVSHFFRSLSDTLGAALHIEVQGENAHHMVEASFKGVARALRMAIARTGGSELPSTKGKL
ncbi:MAG: imidazoleglycerol-phosphate dehydratase HisB, partial [Deltaproteobacteria bacterium]|nr:imidazoleglycerol-phosphate dehydratase HisB [Deltaproteobacteria bacterium]